MTRKCLRRGIKGLDATGHTRIDSGVQDRLADFLDAAAVGQSAGDVDLELIGFGQRGQGGQRNQAAGFAVQAWPGPYVTEAVASDEVLERAIEVRSLRIALLGAARPEHLASHLHACGECRVLGFVHMYPRFARTKYLCRR